MLPRRLPRSIRESGGLGVAGNEIDEIRTQRFTFLLAVYRAADGNTQEYVNWDPIAEELGFDTRLATNDAGRRRSVSGTAHLVCVPLGSLALTAVSLRPTGNERHQAWPCSRVHTLRSSSEGASRPIKAFVRQPPTRRCASRVPRRASSGLWLRSRTTAPCGRERLALRKDGMAPGRAAGAALPTHTQVGVVLVWGVPMPLATGSPG
jgi:hypothetical protein